METVIKSKNGPIDVDLKELWSYRELFYFLAWRDIKLRYKQTVFGIAWAVMQPFITMIVFSVIFGRLANIPSDNVPYPIFVYAGLLIWNIFSSGLNSSSQSLIGSMNIIQKVYLPKIIIPAASVIVTLVDFLFAGLVFLGIIIYYGFAPHIEGLIFLPISLLVTMMTTLGLGWFLSAVNVKYRDVRYALPFFIQLLIFITPVIYPVSIVSEKYRWLLFLNPIAGAIETFKAGFLGSMPVNWLGLAISSAVAVLFFMLGILYFLKTEKTFADII